MDFRAHQSELTYEVVFAPPLAIVIDNPGRIVSALLSQSELELTLSDISLDDGPLEDYGLTCDIERFHAALVVRTDRFELRISGIEVNDAMNDIMTCVWQAIDSVATGMAPKSHSLLFEIDCEIVNGSYSDAIGKFCRPHQGLPKGTETAVAYYLPPDTNRGFLESSFVLNRSGELDGGILLSTTLVFEGNRFSRDNIFDVARTRLNELLMILDVTIHQDRGNNQ